jgi:hypothetical protein
MIPLALVTQTVQNMPVEDEIVLNALAFLMHWTDDDPIPHVLQAGDYIGFVWSTSATSIDQAKLIINVTFTRKNTFHYRLRRNSNDEVNYEYSTNNIDDINYVKEALRNNDIK